jgi:hypothetical protein
MHRQDIAGSVAFLLSAAQFPFSTARRRNYRGRLKQLKQNSGIEKYN